MPGLHRVRREQHLGHEQDPVAEVDADDPHALDERVVQHLVRAPTALEQDVRALDDLVREPVVEVVVHLRDELVVSQGLQIEVVVSHDECSVSWNDAVSWNSRRSWKMVQSLERAFAILDEVAQRPAGVTAIAERVRLPKSTVARLLASLEDVDAVERFGGARWRIGPGVAALSAAASPERGLISIARPFLADLVAELDEDAGLGLPDGNEIVYVDQVESDNPVQVRDWTGTRAPMHAVPSGFVLLAEWPEEARPRTSPVSSPR